MLFHRDVTEMLLHRVAFTHRNAFTHTQSLLYRDDFTLSNFTHRCQNKQRFFYKGMDLHKELLPTVVSTQTYVNMTPDGGRAFGAKEFSKHMNFTATCEDRDAFRGKGLAQHKPTRVA